MTGTVRVELTPEEWQQVINQLALGKFVEVFQVINKITQQVSQPRVPPADEKDD